MEAEGGVKAVVHNSVIVLAAGVNVLPHLKKERGEGGGAGGGLLLHYGSRLVEGLANTHAQ